MTALEEIRSRWTKATPDPWWATRDLKPAGIYSGEGSGSDVCVAEAFRAADATAIAHAPTDVARLLAAVEGVLGLHESAEILSLTHDGHLDYDGDVLRVYCTACTSDDVKQLIGDCEWTEDDEVVGYPCPTVEAITAALEAS